MTPLLRTTPKPNRSALIRGSVLGGGLVTLLVLAACGHSDAPSPLEVDRAALFANGDFEGGPANTPPPSWVVTAGLDSNGIVYPPQRRADLQIQPGGVAASFTLESLAGPETQADPDLGVAAPFRWPKFGNKVAIVNKRTTNYNVNSLKQVMTVGAGDIDPSDGKIHIRFVVAPVLENPAHPVNQQPYYWVALTNLTTGVALHRDFNASAQPGVPWQVSNNYYYVNWALVDVTSKAGATITAGDQVELELIASGCGLGGHFGHLYVDGIGSTIPGLFVSGTAPASVGAGNNLTYTLTYHNNGANPANGVVVTFDVPPGTTFVAANAPGLNCTLPAAGAPAGSRVTCTIPAAVAAGGTGSFTVTVNVPASTPADSLITEGTYQIAATNISPLIGNKIDTHVSCTLDSQCSAGNWCSISTGLCTPPLDNGAPMPADPPHVAPVLDATCTSPASTLVCASKVCDVKDAKCGYANGTGPCSAANAGVVCRSGACSTNANICISVGGCAVDSECDTKTQWCNISVTTCTAKLPNGTLVPTDAPHTAPVLNSKCTPAAALTSCVSGVCDTRDNKCGFDNEGASTCTKANAATVCRSGFCSANGKCAAAGTCLVDGDCPGAWCNIAAKTCTALEPNGTPMPTDTGHGTTPTINAKCNIDAAALVCQTTVCDVADDKCGLANGTTCIVTKDVQCRSAVCFAADAKCGKPLGETCAGNGDCRSSICDGTSKKCVACSNDAQCGDVASAKVCDLAKGACVPGCRGTGGNHCSGTDLCTSKDNTIGQCGQCIVDTDCKTTEFCSPGDSLSPGKCVAKAANNSPVPSAAPLAGACTPANGTRGCLSGVCNTADNTCGLPDGKPCTEPVQCRVGACTNGTCGKPACLKDADCKSAEYCTTKQACAPKKADGTPLPADGGSTTCSAEQAARVCLSAACTPDNACGPALPAGTVTNGSLEGAGCSCDAAPRQGGSTSLTLVGLAACAAAVAVRRRRK